MLCVDLTLPTPEENLALDEAILAQWAHPRGGELPRETLRFWESPTYFVVLGISCKRTKDVHLEACERDGIPILRRATGGGTVLQGPGCLNYALVLSLTNREELRELRQSYTQILDRVSGALNIEGAAKSGTSDIAVFDQKISGNSQKRTRHAVLHHGTILHGFDVSLLPRWLKEPEKQPTYRSRRSHEDFVVNVTLSPEEIKARIQAAWGAATTPWEAPPLQDLIEKRYGNHQWNERF